MKYSVVVFALMGLFGVMTNLVMANQDKHYIFEAGHPSLQEWLLPEFAPYPKGNKPTQARFQLGQKLFFDQRLSGNSDMACVSCHSPQLGWSDGLARARGFNGKILDRASPVLTNVAYNAFQMWDGRIKNLEAQATAPITNPQEMNKDLGELLVWLNTNQDYISMFAAAYPGQGINKHTLSMAIATFERIQARSGHSAFDQWVAGDAKALNPSQLRGFKLFVGKANCDICHAPPNFVDDGFHNVGVASWGQENPDLGRYLIKPVAISKGAFKTPTLRDVALSAPYFHDGSGTTLKKVVDYYNGGGQVKQGVSPNLKPLNLTEREKLDLVAFLKTLTTHDREQQVNWQRIP